MELLQVESEFAPVRDIYAAAAPRRVLEIGCWDGGTLKVWLERCGADATVVAVDPNHRNQDAYDEWRQTDTNLVLIHGMSQDSDVIEQIRSLAPFDWVFIDGDHGMEAVTSDVAVCLPLLGEGGFLLLHDIVPEYGLPDYPPGRVLDGLEASGHTVERFVEDNQDPWAHGLGLVRL